MGEAAPALPESIGPLSATLSPATSALSDLTLEEIEDSISKLHLVTQPESSPAEPSRDSHAVSNGSQNGGAVAPADSRPPMPHADETTAGAANGSPGVSSAHQADSGHTLAPLPQSAPQSLEVCSRSASRSPSPGIKRAGTPSWKISSQVRLYLRSFKPRKSGA